MVANPARGQLNRENETVESSRRNIVHICTVVLYVLFIQLLQVKALVTAVRKGNRQSRAYTF